MTTLEKTEDLPLIKINPKEAMWLDTHGGRNQYDVEEDEKGKYVWMTDGYGDIRVYILAKFGRS